MTRGRHWPDDSAPGGEPTQVPDIWTRGAGPNQRLLSSRADRDVYDLQSLGLQQQAGLLRIQRQQPQLNRALRAVSAGDDSLTVRRPGDCPAIVAERRQVTNSARLR